MKQIFKIAAYGGAIMGTIFGVTDYSIDVLLSNDIDHWAQYTLDAALHSLKYGTGLGFGAYAMKEKIFAPT